MKALVTLIFLNTLIFTSAGFASQQCISNLASLITGKEKQRNFIFKAKVKGKLVTLKGALQDELEVRIELKPSSTHTAESLLREVIKNNQWTLADIEMPRTAIPVHARKGVESLMMSPLKTEFESWHGSPTDAAKNAPGQFTKKIETNFSYNSNGDVSHTSVIVGAQHEFSTYYDTRSGFFEKQGIAIRVKTWYPYSSRRDGDFIASGTSLFIKLNQKNTGASHVRKELQIDIAEDISTTDLESIVTAALAKLEAKKPANIKLIPVVEVINRRFTMVLNFETFISSYSRENIYESEKVGFITFDSFVSKDPRTDIQNFELSPTIFDSRKAQHQIEIEFSPGSQSIYFEKSQQWDLELEAFAKKFGGRISKTPKYIKAKQKLR